MTSGHKNVAKICFATNIPGAPLSFENSMGCQECSLQSGFWGKSAIFPLEKLHSLCYAGGLLSFCGFWPKLTKNRNSRLSRLAGGLSWQGWGQNQSLFPIREILGVAPPEFFGVQEAQIRDPCRVLGSRTPPGNRNSGEISDFGIFRVSLGNLADPVRVFGFWLGGAPKWSRGNLGPKWVSD